MINPNFLFQRHLILLESYTIPNLLISEANIRARKFSRLLSSIFIQRLWTRTQVFLLTPSSPLILTQSLDFCHCLCGFSFSSFHCQVAFRFRNCGFLYFTVIQCDFKSQYLVRDPTLSDILANNKWTHWIQIMRQCLGIIKIAFEKFKPPSFYSVDKNSVVVSVLYDFFRVKVFALITSLFSVLCL